MRITTIFTIVSILQIAAPAAAGEADSRGRRRAEAVKGNSIFGRNRLTGPTEAVKGSSTFGRNRLTGPQSTSVNNARPRQLHNGPIYHHGQVPIGVTLPEMEEGTIYHLSVEESNLVKKGGKAGKGEREKLGYVTDAGDGEDTTSPPSSAPGKITDEGDGEATTSPPDDYESSAPGKIQKGKGRIPSEDEEVTHPPEDDSERYDDADEEDYEETMKVAYYKKGYYPKKYQSDKLPSSFPKELPVLKSHTLPDKADRTPKGPPPVPVPRPVGDAKHAAPKDATEANGSDLAIVPDEGTLTADAEDVGKLVRCK
jgi:hypothetical protein